MTDDDHSPQKVRQESRGSRNDALDDWIQTISDLSTPYDDRERIKKKRCQFDLDVCDDAFVKIGTTLGSQLIQQNEIV
jgi:hypothetical protein